MYAGDLTGTIINGLLDNPCTLLSNIGSYTNWTPEYNYLRCKRTVDNSYAALNNTVWKNSLNQQGAWNGTSVGIDADGGWCKCTICSPSGTWRQGGSTSWAGYLIRCSFLSYNCFFGGVLNGSICTKIDTEYKNFIDIQ